MFDLLKFKKIRGGESSLFDCLCCCLSLFSNTQFFHFVKPLSLGWTSTNSCFASIYTNKSPPVKKRGGASKPKKRGKTLGQRNTPKKPPRRLPSPATKVEFNEEEKDEDGLWFGTSPDAPRCGSLRLTPGNCQSWGRFFFCWKTIQNHFKNINMINTHLIPLKTHFKKMWFWVVDWLLLFCVCDPYKVVFLVVVIMSLCFFCSCICIWNFICIYHCFCFSIIAFSKRIKNGCQNHKIRLLLSWIY